MVPVVVVCLSLFFLSPTSRLEAIINNKRRRRRLSVHTFPLRVGRLSAYKLSQMTSH